MIHRLRPASSSDFDWLLALAGGREDGVAPAEQRARFTRAFASQPWWVVEVEREPVGALSVGWDADPIVLCTVALQPAWHGRGLGTRLVHDVLLRARELQRPVVVELPAGNLAVALFERLGFWPLEGETATETDAAPMCVRLRWQASLRTDVTLQAAMSPWLDRKRRRAWVRRLFEAPADDQAGFCRFAAGRYGLSAEPAALVMHCGPGRLLRPLTALGVRTTAYEADPDYHATASRMAAVVGETTSVHRGGLLDLDGVRAYDLAIAFDGALWALLAHEARVDALGRLRQALRPGGVLLLEGPNFPWILKAYREPPATTEIYHRATVSRIPAHTLDFHDGVLEHRDTFVVEVDDQEPVEWLEERRLALLGLPLLRVALEQAGFGAIETFRDLRATGPARISGPRIVLSARAS
jgi:N-acetylglutamate synthase-like GNAT family acetyltransferase/SAM-dependent methyltransferase